MNHWRRLRRELSHRIHLTRGREVAILSQWLGGDPGQMLLDLGCGDAYWTHRLVGIAKRSIGIDLSDDAIEYAHAFYALSNLTFVQSTAEKLPFDDGVFDRALCLCALQNFSDPQAALRELGRVMNPGGRLVLSVDSLLAPTWVSEDYRQYHAVRFKTGRFFNFDVITTDLASAGFQIQEYRWLLRSRFAAFWAMQQERFGWSVNWWFPISSPMTWLADRLVEKENPGLILLILAGRK